MLFNYVVIALYWLYSITNVCPTFPISTCAIPSVTLDDKDTNWTIVLLKNDTFLLLIGQTLKFERANQNHSSEQVLYFCHCLYNGSVDKILYQFISLS